MMSADNSEFKPTGGQEAAMKIEEWPGGEGSTIPDASGVRTNSTRCGEVFIVDIDKLIIICSFCDEIHPGMQQFGEHIRTKHLYLDIDGDVSPFEGKPEDNLDFEPNIQEPQLTTEELQLGGNNQYKPELMTNNEVKKETDSWLDSEDDGKETLPNSDLEQTDEKSVEISKPAENSDLFCARCNRQYKSTITFNRHVKNMHNKRKKASQKSPALKCRYCDKEFSTTEELHDHKKTHDRLRPFQCPQCPKSFTSSNHRQKHIHMHMGYRPYKCSQCPSAFGTECNLRQHLLTHAVAGTLSCEICGKQFIHQSRKDVHMRSHTGEKPFQCELCGRKFIIRSRLTEHMKRHNNTRNHECDVCGKRFYTNVMLNHHKVAHSVDRPFVCADCGKTFPRKISLKMHRKIHSEVKQYGCNICGKEFKQYAGLYAHRKSHGEKKGLPQTNIAISDKFTPPTHLLIVKNDETSDMVV